MQTLLALALLCSVVSMAFGKSIYTPRSQYDMPALRACPGNSVLTQYRSKFSSSKRDRVGKFRCHITDKVVSNGKWSSIVNEFDEPFKFVCPGNGFINGEFSYHDNEKEDRRFRFLCSSMESFGHTNCSWSRYSRLRRGFIRSAKPGQVIRGCKSSHSNLIEDRRFSFYFCTYQYQANDTQTSETE